MFVAVRVVYQRRMPLANSVSAELNVLAALRHVSQETLPHHQLSYLRLCACKSSMGAVTAVAALAGPESSSALDFFFSFFTHLLYSQLVRRVKLYGLCSSIMWLSVLHAEALIALPQQ